MGWFKSSIDDRIKALVAQSVAAYVERAKLAYQFLTVEPRVSAAEMAVVWVVFTDNSAMARIKSSETSELNDQIDSTANEFFLTFCQDYIENICHSPLKLYSDSPQIFSLIHPTLEAMPIERARTIANLIGVISVNAIELAGTTINLLSASLVKARAKSAERYAFSLIENESKLNPFERQKANEWITAFWTEILSSA